MMMTMMMIMDLHFFIISFQCNSNWINKGTLHLNELQIVANFMKKKKNKNDRAGRKWIEFRTGPKGESERDGVVQRMKDDNVVTKTWF